MNKNILAVDITHMLVYDFLKEGETEAELLERANNSKQKEIETWGNHCKKYPHKGTIFFEYLNQAEGKEYKIMTFEEYQKAERDYYINRPIQEITEEKFCEMLDVLPPKCWTTIQGIEMFCISEMITGSYTRQYAKTPVGEKYYTKIVDILDKSTWIHNFL